MRQAAGLLARLFNGRGEASGETPATTADARRDGRPERVARHLRPEVWAAANRLLVRKAIAEFSHELLIAPRHLGGDGDFGLYTVGDESAGGAYRFRARRLALDHWLIDADSIDKRRNGEAAPLDALSFILEFREALGIATSMLPLYLDEISSILYASAYKRAVKPHRAADLALADFQTIEGAMTEGHPTFVANSGRIGFDALDYTAYAPEAASPARIVWLAVRRARATFAAISGLDYERLMAEELGLATRRAFEARLRAEGLDPAGYYFMPMHPWQWFNRLAIGFASEIADRSIVCLGVSPDAYQPQQSIRTLFNASRPSRRYVKTSLSILNMGFVLMRGMSPADMLATPAINDWLKDLLDRDAYLSGNGFSLICEVATIGYRHRYCDEGLGADAPQLGMLSALWRDSPVPLLRPGERLMTMAALLHLDTGGEALVAALVEASGVAAAVWIRRYLKAYFAPLLHCFYAYDIAFMPHGENVILVLKNDIPVRIVMKDLAEEMRILNDGAGLPAEVRRNAAAAPDELRLDCLFTDVFDGFFRHLAAILDEKSVLEETRFWSLVAECVRDHQRDNPGLAGKFSRYDPFVPRFARNCINRLQLRDNQRLLDQTDPEKGFRYVGTLDNPIAPFGPAVRTRPEPVREAARSI